MTTDHSGVFTLAGSPADPGPSATASDHLSDARAALVAARVALGHAREELVCAARSVERSLVVTGADRCVTNARHGLGSAETWIAQAITDIDARLSPHGA